jgi:hypothetical protein
MNKSDGRHIHPYVDKEKRKSGIKKKWNVSRDAKNSPQLQRH